jgi:phage terminase small subunit
VKLTPKQERFCQAYIETGNASEAYRQAYSRDCSGATAKVNAQKVLNNTNVALTIEALQDEHKHRHAVTVDHIVNELERARIVAMERGQGSAMVSASMGKAKLMGLITDRKLHGEDKDNPLPTKVVISYGDSD